MNNRNYKLKLYKENNQNCLRLSNYNQVIRTWFGTFAELIFDETLVKCNNPNRNIKALYLNKKQVHTFFVDTTCLYQKSMYYYEIEKDLIKYDFPRTSFNVGKSLLLQIRMNQLHPSYDDLLSYYLGEFNTFNLSLFDKTLKLLIDKNMIQSIVTEDGNQYFDKNPIPHSHIYFEQHQRLVDCSSEIAHFLNNLSNTNKKLSRNNNIFYVNNQLKVKEETVNFY